jgi:hypothetical protein
MGETSYDEVPDAVPAFMGIRDRIVEFRRISAAELMANPANFREHPAMQRSAMLGALKEIGVTDVIKVYYSKRYGGKLTLIDGHLRKDIAPSMSWPAIVTNLTDEEADKDLLTGDALSSLASLNAEMLQMLIDQTPPMQSSALNELLEHTKAMAGIGDSPKPKEDEEDDGEADEREFWPKLSFPVPIPVQRTWQQKLGAAGYEPHELLASYLGVSLDEEGAGEGDG